MVKLPVVYTGLVVVCRLRLADRPDLTHPVFVLTSFKIAPPGVPIWPESGIMPWLGVVPTVQSSKMVEQCKWRTSHAVSFTHLLGNNYDEQYVRVKQQPDRRDDGDGHAQHERHRVLGARLRPVHPHASRVRLSRSLTLPAP